MKTQNTIILTFLMCLFLSVNVFASGGKKETKAVMAESREIRHLVNYPEFASSENIEGVVVVKYEVDADNKLHVIEISGSDEKLKEYVFSRMDGTKIHNAVNQEGSRSLKFTFVLL